jgi:hypothetical protein
MLRGAIDYSDGWRIGGWLYSAELPLRDRPVLAFVDGACVGAGKIDVFRQDLADAGLGDGHSGFDFPITLARIDDRTRAYIKLELSDLALLQRTAGIVDEASPLAEPNRYTADSIAWMRDRAWLDDAAARFIEELALSGGYGHPLPDGFEPVAEAKRLFELFRQSPVGVEESLIRLKNLSEERLRLVEGAALPIIAIHGRDGEVLLERAPAGSTDEASGLMPQRYPCGEDSLLFLDTRADFSSALDVTVKVYRAVAAEHRAN